MCIVHQLVHLHLRRLTQAELVGRWTSILFFIQQMWWGILPPLSCSVNAIALAYSLSCICLCPDRRGTAEAWDLKLLLVLWYRLLLALLLHRLTLEAISNVLLQIMIECCVERIGIRFFKGQSIFELISTSITRWLKLRAPWEPLEILGEELVLFNSHCLSLLETTKSSLFAWCSIIAFFKRFLCLVICRIRSIDIIESWIWTLVILWLSHCCILTKFHIFIIVQRATLPRTKHPLIEGIIIQVN